jgi:hypothetical protein
MNAAKIRLSADESELVQNAEWILTKNAILQKVKLLLEDLQGSFLQEIKKNTHLPEEVAMTSPKISKGENYRGLPYLVLDLPRYFNKKDIFAIRTMFWWGNSFSITLQLSGKYKDQFAESVINKLELLGKNDFYYCVNGNQWEHHFENDNYIPLYGNNLQEAINIIQHKEFLKLAYKIPLTRWDDARELLETCYRKVLLAVSD